MYFFFNLCSVIQNIIAERVLAKIYSVALTNLSEFEAKVGSSFFIIKSKSFLSFSCPVRGGFRNFI